MGKKEDARERARIQREQSEEYETFKKEIEAQKKPLNDCRHWGENRADEFYFDVGCVIGHSWCDPEKCPDYEKTSQ